jgi:hypothetical protein
MYQSLSLEGCRAAGSSLSLLVQSIYVHTTTPTPPTTRHHGILTLHTLTHWKAQVPAAGLEFCLTAQRVWPARYWQLMRVVATPVTFRSSIAILSVCFSSDFSVCSPPDDGHEGMTTNTTLRAGTTGRLGLANAGTLRVQHHRAVYVRPST